MMRSALLVALAVTTLSVSGCLDLFDRGPDYDEVDADVRGDYELVADGFSNQTTANTRQIGYHNGFDASGDANAIPEGGYYTELEMTENYVYLARGSTGPVGTIGSYGGFGIIDIADPTDPILVGTYDAPTGSDIEVNADETIAFFGTQRNTVEEIVGRAATTQNLAPALPRGIHVVDISDKAAPSLLQFLPLPYNGVHTITYHSHANGNEYLFVATYDFWGNTVPVGSVPAAVPPIGPDPLTATQRVIVYQIMNNDGPLIVPVGQFQLLDIPPAGKLYFPHDTYVQAHPLTGDTLLYVSYWDKGLRVVDINDPTNPQELDGYTEFAPSTRGNIHFSRPFDEMIDGKHITVTEPEIITADETGYFTFLDTTDPTNILKISRTSHWTLPGERIVSNLDYSPHNFDLRDGKVALAHNMAGLWIVDVSTPDNLMEPKTVGYYLADVERDNNPKAPTYTWGALWMDDDTIVLSDEGSGLHIIEYTGP